MNISRKQLYALGEPFGDCATQKKLGGGGRIYGGGSPSTPAETTQTSMNELPEWARGYAKDTLAKTAALTDPSQNPYKQYGGERIAGFQPMQQKSFDAAGNMQTAGQLGLGTGLAGAAGIGALGTNYQGGQFSGGQFGSNAAQQYMNPYMQNVVDIQQREAQRQADIAGTQRGAQAVKSGAFGGSRQAIMDAEAARNLAMQKGDIQAQGLNQSYQQAQNQFNADMARNMQAQQLGEQSRQYGAGLGMQGLQTALQSAGQLGQLGQTQFGQQKDIIGVQNQLGQQQQQQVQRPFDMAYQDFINQQNQPYKQLGFMSDMIRGLPLGQQSTSSIYQASPSGLQTLGALGMGAYGLNQMFGSPTQQKAADGGLMGSYADGGVTGQDNIENIISKLSPEQLQQAKEAALNRRDIQTVEMIDARLAELAQAKSLSAGLGSAFDQIPSEQQEAMMAGGGIVAFANRGLVGDEEDPDLEGVVSDAMEVTPDTQQQELAKIEGIQYKAMTPQQRNAAIAEGRRALEAGVGPSPYANFERKLTGMEAEDAKGLAQAKGLAALSAIPAILQGGNGLRGIAAGAGAFGSAYGQALQANKAQQRAAMSMRMNLAESQRKERMGLNREAIAFANQASKDHDAEQMFGLEKAKAMATIAARTKPTSAKPNFDLDSRDVLAADLKATTPMKKGETPEQYDTRLKAMATREIYGAKGIKDITTRGTTQVTSNQTRDIEPGGAEAKAKADVVAGDLAKAAETAVQKVKSSIPYLQATKRKDQVTMDRLEKEAREGVSKGFETARQVVTPNAAPTAAPKLAPKGAGARTAPTPKSVLPPGSTTGKLVRGKGTEVFVNGKLVGYAK
jgi:hypothetical protein